MNIEVIGISRDLAPSQARFKETVGAQNTFLSDVEANVISAYGALNANRGTSRYYFLIDEEGTVIWKDTTARLIPIEQLLTQLGEAAGAN